MNGKGYNIAITELALLSTTYAALGLIVIDIVVNGPGVEHLVASAVFLIILTMLEVLSGSHGCSIAIIGSDIVSYCDGEIDFRVSMEDVQEVYLSVKNSQIIVVRTDHSVVTLRPLIFSGKAILIPCYLLSEAQRTEHFLPIKWRFK